MMDAPIHFCTTSDGVCIAYSVNGEGLPLVKVMGYVTHVELDGDPWLRFRDAHRRDPWVPPHPL